MLSDLLFELGTEELPSGAVWPLVDALAKHLEASLLREKIPHGEIHCFATPRRLAVLIYDVGTEQASQSISRRGPAYAAGVNADGLPLPPLVGFAKSCGVPIESLQTLKTDKGEWWVYEAVAPGAKTKDLLPGFIREAIAALPIIKPMRWGDGEAMFVRPVHWAVLLFGEEVIKTHILGVETGRHSFGHRFHHPEAIDIIAPRDYESLLKKGFVIADFAKRRQMIIDEVQQLATSHNYQAVMPTSLVDEVTSIVEWPEALLVNFEETFLEVPSEALIAAMQSHQKCFALRDSQDKLVPHFITVANIASSNPLKVVKGNENVMRARLSDAAFFYNQDRRQKLSEYSAQTEKVVFQARLGSLYEKAMRLQVLMESLVVPLNLSQTEAMRAAALSKCDLMTGMVAEFPELQGLMGYYYASNDGEAAGVAKALNEQYMPRFAADELPQENLGLALSLVDRIDTLVGAFAIGQKPSGDKDPFKLRRHALAIVRLLMAIPWPLSLTTLLNHALQVYGESVQPVNAAFAELKPFILERLQSFYQLQGIAYDRVLAVRAREDDWLYDINQRIEALSEFVHLPAAVSLSAACKRVNNLLQQAKSSTDLGIVDVTLFTEPAEKVLFEQVLAAEGEVTPLYSTGDYASILKRLANLQTPVDTFFEEIMVMVDDASIKKNRLNLLARLQGLLQGVADISLLKIGS